MTLMQHSSEWMGEWSLFNSNWAMFTFDEMMMLSAKLCFVQDQHSKFDFDSAISLKQQSAGRHVAQLEHVILIPSKQVFTLTP